MDDDIPDVWTCDVCGLTYYPNSQRGQCPHEYTTTFTKAMRDELRRRLHLEPKQ